MAADADEDEAVSGEPGSILPRGVPRTYAEAAMESEIAALRCDLVILLAVATLYVDAFGEDEMMTLPEKLRLQDVEDVVNRHGRRY